jgi:hypothetical protein
LYIENQVEDLAFFQEYQYGTCLSQRIIEYQDDNLSSLNEGENDFLLQFAKHLHNNGMKSLHEETAA